MVLLDYTVADPEILKKGGWGRKMKYHPVVVESPAILQISQFWGRQKIRTRRPCIPKLALSLRH